MNLDDIIRESVSYGINNPNYNTPMEDTLTKMALDSSLRLDPQQDINLYADGGYKPSNSIKKRISKWEGASMKTNRPFDVEAEAFNRYLPKEALSKLSQSQLDGLFSYSYNVGSGNFNKRTVPTLKKYLQGKATIADVQKSMYAAGDKKYKGLYNRRQAERAMFGGVNTAPVSYNPTPVINTPDIPYSVNPSLNLTAYTPTTYTPTTYIDDTPSYTSVGPEYVESTPTLGLQQLYDYGFFDIPQHQTSNINITI